LRLAGKTNDGRSKLDEVTAPGKLGLILILSLTCGCLATIAAVWWYYTVQKNETEAATLRGIFAVASGKSDQVANWRRERMGDGKVVMSSAVMRTAGRVLSSPAATDRDRADILHLMRLLAGAFLYADIALVDLEGNVRVRLHENEIAAGFDKDYLSEAARQANKSNDVVLSDLIETRNGRPMMSLTVPVHDFGAFVLSIDPYRFLYPYLETWPGSNRTGESLLIRLEGKEIVYLNRSRNNPGLTPFSRRPLSLKLAPEEVLVSGWALKGFDHRGVPVIATIRRIPDSPWFLSCKIDSAEVDAPLHQLGWQMLLVTALIGLTNATGAGLIWRGQQARIHREREAWLYAAANDTPACLWMASAGEGISFINRPFREFLGLDRQDAAKDWIDYLHPDDAGSARAALAGAMSQAQRYTAEFRIRRFDGEYRMVVSEAVPRLSGTGRLLGFAGSILDITARRQAEEQLRTANMNLQTELAERIRKEHEIQTLSARLIGAREDERKRLAQELHDDLNQQIAAVSIAIGNLKRKIPVELMEALSQSDRIHRNLVQIAETVRRMSHELHPVILECYGLAVALRSCCGDFGDLTGVHVSLSTDGSFDDVQSSTALCVYRITQEALQNVAKHAKASAVKVELRRVPGILLLTVSDSGVGIDPAKVKEHAGLGLISIKERVRFVGGSVEIYSKPNEGTSLAVTIPLGDAAMGMASSGG
jgi:two-component system sensor histidine kinase UhpB